MQRGRRDTPDTSARRSPDTSRPGVANAIGEIRTPPADAVMLLGDVRKIQEVCEGARQRRRGFDRERREERRQFRELRFIAAREAFDSARTRSTVSNNSSPPRVLRVWPRSSPSSRTSSRSGL
jgi:hypothetical protein